MCGLLGFYAGSSSFYSRAATWMDSAINTLTHRGPDSQGTVFNPEIRFGLAHTRLAIVDLSEAGHQPMSAENNAWHIVFNGEIYNHLALRKELEQQFGNMNWRGHSDTETLLAGFARWGFESTLQKAVGMFAIAAMEINERRLFLARDRFGEKPLYFYTNSANGIAFASELKTLVFSEFVPKEINHQALGDFLQKQYIGSSDSIYKNVFKVKPAHYITIDQTQTGLRVGPQKPYWSYADTIAQSASNPITDESLALKELERLLRQTIEEQMIADVPLGAFLSGGVDSSLIAALMQSQSNRAIDTFTVGFDNADYDESNHARAVANHLGTNHHELRLTAKDALNVIAQLPAMYCEPFADSSQIPTHLVCQAAKNVATVALSGDAGDEVFGGYNRYLWGERVWRKVSPLGIWGRNAIANSILCLSPSAWDSVASFGRATEGSKGVGRVGEKLHKLASKMHNCGTLDQFYTNLTSEWLQPELILRDPWSNDNEQDQVPLAISENPIAKMMYKDGMEYLPGDILTKVDRASMAISLETRAPFLDHRVVSFAWRLPQHMKIRDGVGKWPLRKLLYQHVPRALIERPKTGFSIPLSFWLRNELRDWAEHLLNPIFKNQSPWFESKLIQKTWIAHQTGKYDHSAKLWSILMFQAWLETNKPS